MIRLKAGVFAFILIALGLCAGGARAQTLYGITIATNQLITINPATGTGTLVGLTPATP